MSGALSCAAPALGHEFWIEPQKYQVQSGDELKADFRNGRKFRGVALAYFPAQTRRFEIAQNGKVTRVEGRMGDLPALDIIVQADGLLVVAHETAPSSVKYKNWDDFQAFAEHKDFPDILKRHRERGLPEAGFTETYTRHVKALVGVGTSQGHDREMGLETEFVALSNPYTDDPGDGFQVRLFYQGAPRADAQVEIFARAPDGEVTVTTTRTDAGGNAVIEVSPGNDYMLDAVVLRPAPEDDPAVWATLWAGLTFHVP